MPAGDRPTRDALYHTPCTPCHATRTTCHALPCPPFRSDRFLRISISITTPTPPHPQLSRRPGRQHRPWPRWCTWSGAFGRKDRWKDQLRSRVKALGFCVRSQLDGRTKERQSRSSRQQRASKYSTLIKLSIKLAGYCWIWGSVP